MRTEAEAAKILTDFESESRAFGLSVRGISVWRLIRFAVGLSLQNLPFESPRLPRGQLLVAVLRSIRDLVALPKGVRYAVKSYVSALRIRGQSGYEDIYFESLLDQVPGGIRLYSFNAAGYFGRPTSSKAPSVDCTAVNVIGALLARMFPIREGDPVFKQLGNLVAERLGIEGFSARRICRTFSSFWWQSSLYERILHRLGAKTVFVADTGERALLNACRRLEIRFIELQHGVFTPDHPDSLPFSALSGVDESPLLLPDVVALYGEYWCTRQAGTLAGRAGLILPIGASIIEKFRALRATNFRPSSDYPQLLVTTQGIDRDALIEFLSRFLSLYREQCQLTIKLHPAYDRLSRLYAATLGSDPRVRIVAGADDPNTYELIAQSDLHLSISSACHYDALGIGTPTLVIGLAGYQLVQDILDAGDASFASNPEELAGIISRRAWGPVVPTASRRYYRDGFVKNLLPLIS